MERYEEGSNVPLYVCDHCDNEIHGDVYDVDGEDLCEDCLKRMFLKVYLRGWCHEEESIQEQDGNVSVL